MENLRSPGLPTVVRGMKALGVELPVAPDPVGPFDPPAVVAGGTLRIDAGKFDPPLPLLRDRPNLVGDFREIPIRFMTSTEPGRALVQCPAAPHAAPRLLCRRSQPGTTLDRYGRDRDRQVGPRSGTRPSMPSWLGSHMSEEPARWCIGMTPTARVLLGGGYNTIAGTLAMRVRTQYQRN